ncbi:DNA polymerase sliding clamp [uncultured archaeon]|nr:DNA polymerase sliding clamp [uncultured archaeon]
MHFVVKDSKNFKTYVDAITVLVDEGSFQIDSQGIHLRTMDPSQIALVDFNLPKEGLKELNAEEKISLSLNLLDLGKILSRGKADDTLTVTLEEKESKLMLEFKGKTKRSFKVPLLDLNTQLPKEPKVPFDSTIKVSGGEFKDMLKDAGLVSSHVVIEASPTELIVEAHGDSGDVRIETPKGDSIKINATQKTRSMFPFEYLDNITKNCPDTTEIELSLKTDAPIRISYNLGEATLAYYLAPRVEN